MSLGVQEKTASEDCFREDSLRGARPKYYQEETASEAGFLRSTTKTASEELARSSTKTASEAFRRAQANSRYMLDRLTRATSYTG